MGYVIATDTGGTFVDAVIIDERGELHLGKASSTPTEPAKGLMASIEAAAGRMASSLAKVLANCQMFVNGTTVTTNAMIQRRGAKTGLLVTAGFEDTLLIGRVKARTAGLDETEVTNYQHADRPDPIVPITLTRGIRERIDYRGEVITPLNLDEVAEKVDELVSLGIEALAICLLWSFRNPEHERAIGALVAERYPGLYTTLSSDLVPVIREYERANTTAINCFLGPTLARYITGVEETVHQTGYGSELLIMQSIGGLSPAAELKTRSVTSLHSGPVGGIIAAKKLGDVIGQTNIITADMGGTSFDVGMIVDGVPQSQATTIVERNILLVPAIDAISIGAGGGSVAWLDDVLGLRVGPHSMGADPGPACYCRGGTQPTVTDADVVLGYISPDYFLGGTMKLSRERAVRAIRDNIARPLGMTVEEAAEGIYRIVNAHMADLIRKVSVERGHDPRNFALVNFGGCGPTHCTGYGPEIGVGEMLVPYAATVFSALGIAQSDIRHFFSRSATPMTLIPQGGTLSGDQFRVLNDAFGELLDQAAAQLERDGVDRQQMSLVRNIEMRYQGQTNELTIPVGGAGPLNPEGLQTLIAEFVRRYEMLYGRGSSSQLSSIELITLRVDAIVPTSASYRPLPQPSSGSNSRHALVGRRPVYWGASKAYVETPIYRGEQLGVGNVVSGPAVIETYGTTFPLHPDQRLHVDEFHNYVISCG